MWTLTTIAGTLIGLLMVSFAFLLGVSFLMYASRGRTRCVWLSVVVCAAWVAWLLSAATLFLALAGAVVAHFADAQDWHKLANQVFSTLCWPTILGFVGAMWLSFRTRDRLEG